jgi:histidinol-phosphate/aromatic aminotransferase/cobyric acid decarboxylase-like protein/SAM-dependent methyltransferase
MPWYEHYFGADYWRYAGAEYTPSRTAAEVDYLSSVLPGSGRVLDLGCGTGRHSVALARRGYDVVGVDVSAWALARAADAAAEAGVEVEFRRVDLLGPWPALPPVDAVVCVQAFGWGSDAEQLRMLRAARAALTPGGILVLDHSNVSAILRAYQPESVVEVEGSTFHFLRTYDAVSGRSGGELRVRRPDGSAVVLPDDVRLYYPPELATLLARAGFEVERVDADFTAGGPVAPATRSGPSVARAPALPRPALGGYRAAPPAGSVDLRWAPDEIALTGPAVAAAWASLPDAAERSRRYDVTDPYAAARAAPVLAAHLGVPLPAERVTGGAGATGLLCALAGLAVAGGGPVLAAPDGHPELPVAADALGVPVRLAFLSPAAVLRVRPSVVVLDRPGLPGAVWPADAVRDLAAAVDEVGGTLVVDETCANYLPASSSAAVLLRLGGPRRLVVLRSLSKGYCCGGLRVGFALASAEVAPLVRAVCPPLAVGALPLDLGLALLSAGDGVLAGLRDRIAAVKPAYLRLLAGAGLDVSPGDPRLPWVTVPSSALAVLTARGVTGKVVPGVAGAPSVIRLAVPLSADRVAAVESAFGASLAVAAGPGL